MKEEAGYRAQGTGAASVTDLYPVPYTLLFEHRRDP